MANKKILVIEDFDRIRELLDIFLTREGFSVFTTPNGKDGVRLVKSEKPDLTLIDITLQDENGMDVLRDIRVFDKDSKIFTLSGLYTEDLEKESLSNGATGFISKSLGIEAVVKKVADALR